jgi:imidazole glycerol-phosphate synthase subunit HisH
MEKEKFRGAPGCLKPSQQCGVTVDFDEAGGHENKRSSIRPTCSAKMPQAFSFGSPSTNALAFPHQKFNFPKSDRLRARDCMNSRTQSPNSELPGASVAVIDTGICNLRSVTKALEAVGASIRVVHTPAEVEASGALGLVLPGVGALRDCVASLRASKLDTLVRDWVATNRPFLGVCLGMQALFEHSEEGGIRGLGVFAGEVVRFRRPPEFKIPHMGWNTVRFRQQHSPLAAQLAADGEAFYFVHSFHCVPADPDLVLAESDYGGPFCAAIGRGRCFATQFHPEKSQAKGLQIYRNFAVVAAAG